MHLNEVAPKTVMRHLKDDWDISVAAAATHPLFTSEARKYQLTMAQRLGSTCGHAVEHKEAPDLFVVDGRLVPWFEPMAAHMRSCWAKQQSRSAVAFVASLAEGRWGTPKRL